ncbi:hypothetical protein SA496_22295 [Pseudomonas sp. JS3066]|uniref:hypothetical protein n=1 Tax=unclassified Pseudomonas TaxID=196821 RepID=UPI00129E3918|nr:MULTISPECIES: hypothetical protein [unclassified Pseudomonas]MDH4652076.1 hypothetical protein [Pseudomonas sp. BN606]MRK22546.1 hypothetical protein [Pseudomonas sp. JG-B]WVK92415.1 hypothetical protein SA496_22295 [Pseudomonas sp. JS3066]
MAKRDALPLVLHRIHMNQIMLGAALVELAIWIDQCGSPDASEQLCHRLATLEANADFISETIVDLMADS